MKKKLYFLTKKLYNIFFKVVWFQKEDTMAVKYVFVTGGVVSGLGKGITAASLGRLLKARGYTVTMQKFDPYINIDPGTMNPVQHGEVFVTDDGAETDLDLGHYERFIDESLTKNSNVTTGKIYWSVLHKERRGDFGGGTVQVIPHITNEIKSRFYRNPAAKNTEIAIIEVGGTVGDIESQPFLEAIRQFQHERGRENVILIHVTLIPYLRASQEMKTKPTQASVKDLQGMGISLSAVPNTLWINPSGTRSLCSVMSLQSMFFKIWMWNICTKRLLQWKKSILPRLSANVSIWTVRSRI